MGHGPSCLRHRCSRRRGTAPAVEIQEAIGRIEAAYSGPFALPMTRCRCLSLRPTSPSVSISEERSPAPSLGNFTASRAPSAPRPILARAYSRRPAFFRWVKAARTGIAVKGSETAPAKASTPQPHDLSARVVKPEIKTQLDASIGRKARLHGSHRKGPGSAPKPPSHCEREIGFSTRSSLTPNALRAPQPRQFPAFQPSARSL